MMVGLVYTCSFPDQGVTAGRGTLGMRDSSPSCSASLRQCIRPRANGASRYAPSPGVVPADGLAHQCPPVIHLLAQDLICHREWTFPFADPF